MNLPKTFEIIRVSKLQSLILFHVLLTGLPITVQCCFPIPPENMLSGGIEKQHRIAMG